MIGSVAMGVMTGFYFIVALLFSAGGAGAIEEVIRSPLGPLMAILYVSTGNRLLSTVLLAFFFVLGVCCPPCPNSKFALIRNPSAVWPYCNHDDQQPHGICIRPRQRIAPK